MNRLVLILCSAVLPRAGCVIGYGAHDGRLRTASEAKVGFANHAKKVIFLVFGSTKTNFEPAALNRH